MKKYRIWCVHCGDPSEREEAFEAKSDKEAQTYFDKNYKDNVFCTYWMERLDVEEKTTRI